MAAARLAVFPTRQNLQLMKVKLTGAKKGHSLLKKADALTMRLRALLKTILQVRGRVRRTSARSRRRPSALPRAARPKFVRVANPCFRRRRRTWARPSATAT